MPQAGVIIRVGDGTISSTGGVLTPGLRAEYKDAYSRKYKPQNELMSKVMRLDLRSDKAFEIYAYFKSAPYLARWERGQAIRQKAFDSVQFTVPNHRWGIRIEWHKDDEADDQTGSLLGRAREAGESEATLDERVFFQFLTGSTDLDLMPAIPNAPDGAALFATTDGAGAARFGVTGGNIIAGTSNPNSGDIRDMIFDAKKRFKRMLDTESQPLNPPEKIEAGMMLIHGPAMTQQVAEALQQAYPFQTTTNGSAAAAPSNILIDSGAKIQSWNSVRITDNALYMVLTQGTTKPIFRQEREAFYETPADMANSDHTRDTYQRYMQWTGRRGYGIMLPFDIIRCTNA